MAVPVRAALETDSPVSRDYLAHLPEPDYSRGLLQVDSAHRKRILDILAFLYGPRKAVELWPEVERVLRVYYAHKTPELINAEHDFDPCERFSERDVILITYGDLLTGPGRPPLQVLSDFLLRFMRGAINTVHILPFFPYSSDRGFAIVDYEEVDPRLGTWQDIEQLGKNFRLMFDGVFNHASSKSRLFQQFLNGRPGYEDFFIAFTTKDAISKDYLKLILRPRTSDLLTPFRTINGMRYVWTTFGPDQVDLNFKNPRVLLRVLEVLLHYVRRGADVVRLDAVTYIWRELGTSCAHLQQGHALVQLFRAVLDAVAPGVAIITETNVPHEDNISYFGDGANEAQMVYNFALPPLILHSFHSGSAKRLATWAATLRTPSSTTAFCNFLSSHDGIGLLGATGWLSAKEIDALVERTVQHGGLVSYRDNGDGSSSPYELNISYYSALNREDAGEPQEFQVSRFVAARAIALALPGVAGVYFPALFGAKNNTEAILAGHDKRSINRRTLDEEGLYRLLLDRGSWVHQTATRSRRLIKRRIVTPAFHPNSPHRVLEVDDRVFAVLRWTHDGTQRVLALHNVAAAKVAMKVPRDLLATSATDWRDVVSGRELHAEGALEVSLDPYEVAWFVAR
jgi:glucosylglycerate phosphorylase